MNNGWCKLVAFLSSLVPYAAVAWAYIKYLDPDHSAFWIALGVLVAARLVYNILDGIGGILSWRLCGKRSMVRWGLQFLQANKFPLRSYPDDDFSSYLSRIIVDEDSPPSVRTAAREVDRLLEITSDMGAFVGWRFNSAMESALNKHSPRTRST